MNPAMLALLPQELVAATIVVLLLADAFTPDSGKRALAGVAAIGITLALVAAVLALPGPPPGDTALFNGTVAVDTFALFFDVLFLFLTLLVLMLAPAYLERRGVQRGEFYILLVAALMGMMVLVGALNLMTVFIGVELLSIALYVLAAFLRGEERSQEAGLKYLLIGGFASGCLLYGMALLYGGTGTTALPAITSALARLTGDNLLFAMVGIGLVLVGMAFKASAAPFHAWTPDVYEGAPTPLVAFMSVGTKVAAVAVFLRLFAVHFRPSLVAGRWTVLLGAVVALSMLVGAAGALRQTEMKRLMAYSSIAQAGYLLLAVVGGSQQAMIGGLFFLAAYAVMTFGAFAVLSLLAGEDRDTVPIESLRGLGYSQPLAGVALAIAMLSLAGVPPLVGFWGKLFVFAAAIRAGYLALTLVAIVASAISLYYYLRVVALLYTRAPESDGAHRQLDPWGTAAAIFAGALTVLLGILPSILYGWAERSSLL
ncbi:MAG TPA: NADH-quinone oxidoreductase subunit N [Candidatus Dormibacteraeota bacterium]|jgi:NADH-quinone oxidoreductase subunit N|nr:NADH-quinone oxidoreductase subunit N [Candidatus Dormibacteraeota bacterium]